MNGYIKAVIAALLFAAGCLASYALFVPVPTSGLSELLPRPKALAHLGLMGCGLSTTSKGTLTFFCGSAKLNAQVRKTLDSEMSAMKGFVRIEDFRGIHFRKWHGGLMPVTSSVNIFPNGSVSVVVRRDKWPGSS